jgi:DNA polymerase-4
VTAATAPAAGDRATPARRTILHVDMDAFFVSVELRRRPELRGRPVVVGGTGRRGVVAAASYEARRYGVYSAMPSAVARRLCPAAVFLPGDYAAYAAVSREVRALFDAVTPLVEPLSLDEAFLDVTGARALLGDGVSIGRHLREAVADRLQLGCSVGVAPNKFLAKLASVEAKPQAGPDGVRPGRGVFEVRPGEELAYLHPLPVGRLWGVGPKTLERLSRMGVSTVGELAGLDPAVVVGNLGRALGEHLLALAAGRDDRPVQVDLEAKSVSHEETFAHDLHELADVRRELVRLADAVAARLRAGGLAARTFTVKIRDGGFTTISRSATVPGAVDTADAIVRLTAPLLDAIDLAGGVRLLGLAASKFAPPAEQLSFDQLDVDPPGSGPAAVAPGRWSAASHAIDDVRARFGDTAIGPASTVTRHGVRLVRRGNQQWGPDHDARAAPDADRGQDQRPDSASRRPAR